MTHVPFTSRFASLIRFPSAPLQKYDDDNDDAGAGEYYIPYTGTYEPPPPSAGHVHGTATPPGIPGPSSTSSSSHPTYARTQTHVHTHSGSTKVSNTQASSYSSHPYNPDRFFFSPAPQQQQNTTTSPSGLPVPHTLEEPDRGRKAHNNNNNPRRISTSSSFAALAPSEQHFGILGQPIVPKNTPPSSTVQPNPHARRGGPSYLALDGGFIGQSPVAVVPARSGGGEGREGSGRSERSAHRSSFTSFITFGNSRKSVASGSGQGAGSSSHTNTWPHNVSGSAISFPHGSSKLRGELRPGAGVEHGQYYGEEEESGEEMFTRLQPIPLYMRQRSQSYVHPATEKADEERRTTTTTRRGLVVPNPEEFPSHGDELGIMGRHSVKVTMPASFFDVSPVEERDGSNPFGFGTTTKVRSNSYATSSPTTAVPHPYHRHHHHHPPPAIVEPAQDLQGRTVHLNSPTTPSFLDFSHPYATASASTNTHSPSKSYKSRPSHAGLRRPAVPDFHDPDRDRDPREHSHGALSSSSNASAFPFVNPFSFVTAGGYGYHHSPSSPATTRPVTPKGRLKSLVSLGEGFRTLKGSISTPNLRATATKSSHGSRPPTGGGGGGVGGTQFSHSSTRRGTVSTAAHGGESSSRRPSSSRGAIPPNSILQGQTLCDTFFFPRPRFHAHQISPPDSPDSPVFIKEPTAPVRHRQTTATAVPGRPNVQETVPVQREWNRRATAAATSMMTHSDPGEEQRRREMQRLGKKKASAPDLRRRPEKERAGVVVVSKERPMQTQTRPLTEAEKVLLQGEEREREREEWQRTARSSFQNTRSRSLSRTRTRSIAKGSSSAATSGDEREKEREKERERPSRKNTIAGGSTSVAVTVTVTTTAGTGTAPPTATSSSGAATSGEESQSNPREKEKEKEKDKEASRAGVKNSMEYLAVKAFSQGYPTIVPAPPGASSHFHLQHTRHQSGDGSRDRHPKDKTKNRDLTHRRSESWGRTAFKKARNSCADPENASPAIEQVFQPEVGIPLVEHRRGLSHEGKVLDIGPIKQEERPPSEDLYWRPSAIGIAIGTPPLESVLDMGSNRVDQPYTGQAQSPVFVGPHPASPMKSLPQLPLMNDVVSRHRLPPRANTTLSPPRSPDGGLRGLEGHGPPLPMGPGKEARTQSVLSRESWLVYMKAFEEGGERPRTTDKGKGRAVEPEPVIKEERPTGDVPEDVHAAMDTPELQLDLGLDGGSPSQQPTRSHIVPAEDMEAQLTQAFRRRSTASASGSSENEHAALTFEAGATLSRLLSSRSVTSTPRVSVRRTLSNPETPRGKKVVHVGDLEDPQSTVTPIGTSRPPIPLFEPTPTGHHRSSSGGASRRVSGHSDAAASASGHESLWRKSAVSSDFGAQSPPSQESSPKASPRTLVNLDDLEGYSDLFYTGGGHGSISSRPKSSGSNKTTVSSGLVERAFRPEMAIFGQKGGNSGPNSSFPERSSQFAPESSSSSRIGVSRTWNVPSGAVGGLSPPPPPRTMILKPAPAEEPAWGTGSSAKLTEAELERTWDPEEEDEGEDEEGTFFLVLFFWTYFDCSTVFYTRFLPYQRHAPACYGPAHSPHSSTLHKAVCH